MPLSGTATPPRPQLAARLARSDPHRAARRANSCAPCCTRPPRSAGHRHAAQPGARASQLRRARAWRRLGFLRGGQPAGPPAIPAGRLVALVPLLAPRVTVVVIAGGLPEARLILCKQLDAAHPLGRFPEVQLGYKQPGGPAVFWR